QDPFVAYLVSQVSQQDIRGYIKDLQDFGTRYSYSPMCDSAAVYLYNQFAEMGLSVEYDYFDLDGYTKRNVVATLPGVVYPDSFFIICGHYDSYSYDPWNLAPGADDNASGTAATLEAASILSQYYSEVTILFICWAGEEEWMVGSGDYAYRARAEGMAIGGVLNFDMIAYPTTDDSLFMYVFCDYPSEPLADLAVALNTEYDIGLSLTKVIDPNDVSDHYYFWEVGYLALDFCEDTAENIWGGSQPHYHTTHDTLGTLYLPLARRTTQVGVALLATLAGAREEFTGPFVLFSSSVIDDDDLGESMGNNNGWVDPGETIELPVTLINIGSAPATGVTGVLRTSEPYITLADSVESFGDIAPNDTAESADDFDFAVSTNCPNGHFVQFSLEVRDEDGKVWASSFKLQVTLPDFVYQSFTIDEVTGDGDGVVDAAETFDLWVDLKNEGLRDASGITGTLETVHSGVEVTDNTALFSDIPIGGMGDNASDPFTFIVADTISDYLVPFRLVTSEGGGYYTDEIHFNLLIGQGKVLILVDDGGADNSEYYTAALKYLGVRYDGWWVETWGQVPGDSLTAYGDVIWFTGSEANTLTEEDQTNLATYLDSGGNLLLSGSLIGFDIWDAPFYRDYLHANYVHFFTRLHHLNAVPNNPVVEDVAISLSTSGHNQQSWTGEIDPRSPAFTIFEYDQTTPEGTGDIRSSGSGAIGVENGTYKVVYFSFGFEGIEPVENRAEVLGQVLGWFREPGMAKGDVNGDGTVNVLDVVVAVNIILGTHQPTADETARADVNYDSQINILDVVGIVNIILGN
ncbi:MAG: M28 family peptidase, partial [bacterium]